jgi:hypothetical protein
MRGHGRTIPYTDQLHKGGPSKGSIKAPRAYELIHVSIQSHGRQHGQKVEARARFKTQENDVETKLASAYVMPMLDR